MTRTQKILVISSSVLLSVFLGAILYVYFKRKHVWMALKKGETLDFKLKIPKNSEHNPRNYKLKLADDSRDKLHLMYNDVKVGYYKLIDGVPKFINNEAEKIEEIKDEEEIKIIDHIFKKLK